MINSEKDIRMGNVSSWQFPFRALVFVVLIVVSTLVAPCLAHALNISMCPPARFKAMAMDHNNFPRCGSQIWISGVFEPGDYGKVRSFIKQHLRDVVESPLSLRAVTFYDSVGGDIDVAIEIGRLLRRLSLGTQVAAIVEGNGEPYLIFGENLVSYDLNDGICSGACVYAWAGGVVRAGHHALIPQPPEIDTESAGDSSSIPEPDHMLRQKIEAYLVEMGMPADFITFLFRLPMKRNTVALPAEYLDEHLSVFVDRNDPKCAGEVLMKCRDEAAKAIILKSIMSEFSTPE